MPRCTKWTKYSQLHFVLIVFSSYRLACLCFYQWVSLGLQSTVLSESSRALRLASGLTLPHVTFTNPLLKGLPCPKLTADQVSACQGLIPLKIHTPSLRHTRSSFVRWCLHALLCHLRPSGLFIDTTEPMLGSDLLPCAPPECLLLFP